MMLRTTISRIKKVCIVAFVPRLLRGEQRCAPGGKLEILSYAVLRKAPKSTKSTGEDEIAKIKDQDKADEYLFLTREQPELKDKHRINNDPPLGDETFTNKSKPLLASTVPPKETQTEQCQKIIDQAFGKDEPMLEEQYFSHTVNIEETRRKINESQNQFEEILEKPITDDRTQFGVFKMSRELIGDESYLETDDLMNNRSMFEGTSKQEGIKITENTEDLGLVQEALNIRLTSARDPMLDKEETLQTDDSLPLKETIASEDINTYIYNQEKIENKVYFDMDAADDSMFRSNSDKESEMVKDERRNDYHRNVVLSDPDDDLSPMDEVNLNFNLNASCIPSATDENVETYLQNQERFQKILDCYMPSSQKSDEILLATTATENEEQLTQKVEHIEETPLVEAQNPKIEGFNVTPRVLGDVNPSFKCFSGKQIDDHQVGKPADVPASFDEVAKRCLDSPVGKIDEILLKEMDKIGIPITCNIDTSIQSPVMEDDLVQMDELHKHKSIRDKEINLKSHEFEQDAAQLCSTEETFNTRYMNNVKNLPEYDTIEPDEKKLSHSDQVVFNKIILGNSKSPTDQKMTEFEETEKETATIMIQTPVFDPPKLNISHGNEDEQKLTPDYIYTQRNVFRGVDKPTSHYQAMTANTMWNEKQSQPKVEYSTYPQRSQTKKETDNSPSYCQTMKASNINDNWNQQTQTKQEDRNMETIHAQTNYDKGMEKAYNQENVPNRMWQGQNYQQNPYFTYGRNTYGTGADHSYLYYTHHMNTAYMWNNLNTKYMQQNVNKVTNEKFVQPPEAQQKGSRTDQATNSNTHNKTSPHEKFCVPTSTWDNKTMFRPAIDKMTAPLSFNKTNVNVSEKICNKPLESKEISEKLKKESKNSIVPEEILNQQLDPYYVLTCNETCPISPKAVLSASKTSSFVNPMETVYKKDVKDKGPAVEYDIEEQDSPEGTHNSNFTPAVLPDALSSLPNISEKVALSELLKRVRKRSRIIECRNELKALGLEVQPAYGKCGRKAPRCPPTAPRSPPNNPVPPPTFGLPPLKPRPRACKPRKPRTRKCSTCDLDVSPSSHLGLKMNGQAAEIFSEGVCEINDSGTGVCAIRSQADLTEDIIDRLQTLGKILGGVLRQGKSHVVDMAFLARNRRGSKTLLAREYEPWAPIPSWPTHKPPKEKERPCTPGCKVSPPPRVSQYPDPPCNLKPCKGFPKRTFSLIDCFAVTLGENRVYDLGEF